MNTYLNEISKFVDENREEIVSLWKEIVNMESYTHCKESVNKLAKRLKFEFEKEGLDCELVDVGDNGSTLNLNQELTVLYIFHRFLLNILLSQKMRLKLVKL